MDLHIEYICALTNLYGHVSPKRVCAVYNQQNDVQLELADVEAYLKNPKQQIENRYVYIRGEEFLEERLYLLEEKYEKLVAKQKGKPYYVPKKEELLKYAELNYWEKPAEYAELEVHIQTNFFPDQAATGRHLTTEIFEHIKRDNVDDALQLFNHYEIIFEDKKESDAVLYIIQRLNNNTRMKANNGHTPIELSKITGNPTYTLPVILPKDDEDCHCGSGKKYKNCHSESDKKIKRLKDYR